jgi:hypothetical protein
LGVLTVGEAAAAGVGAIVVGGAWLYSSHEVNQTQGYYDLDQQQQLLNRNVQAQIQAWKAAHPQSASAGPGASTGASSSGSPPSRPCPGGAGQQPPNTPPTNTTSPLPDDPLGKIIQNLINQNLCQFGYCQEFATGLSSNAQAAGISGTVYTYQGWPGMLTAGPIGEDVPVSTNGFHQWVEINGTVYDNMFPNGVPANDYNVFEMGVKPVQATSQGRF